MNLSGRHEVPPALPARPLRRLDAIPRRDCWSASSQRRGSLPPLVVPFLARSSPVVLCEGSRGVLFWLNQVPDVAVQVLKDGNGTVGLLAWLSNEAYA